MKRGVPKRRRLRRSSHGLAVCAAVLAVVALLPPVAAAQVSADPSPNPVTLEAGGAAQPVTVTTQATAFQLPITYSFVGFPAGVSTGGSQTTFFPYPPVTFSFSADPGVAGGTYIGSLLGSTAGGTFSVPMTVIVRQPDFALSVTPASLSLAPGGTAAATVAVTRLDGFAGPVSIVAPSLPGITITPAALELGTASRTVTITADPTAQPGPRAGAFRGTAAGIAGERTAGISVQVTEAPTPPPLQDFTLQVAPASMSLAPGEAGVVNVSATRVGGFAGPIAVTVQAPAVVSVQPASFTLTGQEPRAVTLTPAAAAASGTVPVVLTGIAAGIGGSRNATASVVIRPPGPVIRSITPPGVVTGTTANTLRITGENFQPGATVTSRSPGVQVVSARVLAPTSAEVVVSVRPDLRPGPYRVDLQNPDGGLASGEATLLVYPPGALGAPLAVTGAAIVAPRPRQIVELGERLYARGLLATSGMGTVVGTWLLDGVPFDRFTRVVAGGFPVEVRSTIPIPLTFTGEHHLELAIESPASLPVQRVPFFQAVESRSELRVLAPSTGAAVDPEAPTFRWTLVPGASGYLLEVDDAAAEEDGRADADRPGPRVYRRTTETEWRPDETTLRQLGTGPKRFRVRAIFPGEVPGPPAPWTSFELTPPPVDVQSPEIPAGGASSPVAPPGLPGSLSELAGRLAVSWRRPDATLWTAPGRTRRTGQPEDESGGQIGLTLLNTTTTNSQSDFPDPPTLNRLQLSTQTDLRGNGFEQQATADLSGSLELEEPWDAEEESRNWLTSFAARQGAFREEARIGFAPPSFFDQAELLTVVSAGGGLQGTFRSPGGSVAYYHSLDLSQDAGFALPEPDVEAAAYEAPLGQDRRFLLRAMGLRVTEPEVPGFSAAGEGEALGLIGVAHVSSALRLVGEAAGGDFEPGPESFEQARDGGAFRLGLDGSAGTFAYALTLGRTGEGFVNPANRGFTPAGVSGRTRAELSLQKDFGEVSLSGRYGHVRGGIFEGAGDPDTRENSAGLLLSFPLGSRVTVSAGGHLVDQRGDALTEFALPETDRTQHGLDLAVSETVGVFNFSQTVTWQDFTDEVQPISDQRVLGASLAVNGALARFLNLWGNVSNTRSKGAIEVGRTNQLLVSLQPSLAFEELWLALTPRAAWSRTTNDLDESEFRSDQYQVVVRWSPPWAGTLLNLEVGSDWNRSWTHLDPAPPPFQRQLVATLTLNRQLDRSWPSAPEPIADVARIASARARR